MTTSKETRSPAEWKASWRHTSSYAHSHPRTRVSSTAAQPSVGMAASGRAGEKKGSSSPDGLRSRVDGGVALQKVGLRV